MLSVEEKSQIQALHRTQPDLPLKKARASTMTHDYKQHGTITLFAALNVFDGTFILDNYVTHKHPKVRRWLDWHPRFVFHFLPTSSSWLNTVEGFFANLSKRGLKRDVFRPIVNLQAAINRLVAEHNNDPKPFTWTANPNTIIAAIRRGHQTLFSIH